MSNWINVVLSFIAFEERLMMMNCPFDCSCSTIVSYAAGFALWEPKEKLQKAHGFQDGALGSCVALGDRLRCNSLGWECWDFCHFSWFLRDKFNILVRVYSEDWHFEDATPIVSVSVCNMRGKYCRRKLEVLSQKAKMLGPPLLAAQSVMILNQQDRRWLVSEILNKSVLPLNLEKASLPSYFSSPSPSWAPSSRVAGGLLAYSLIKTPLFFTASLTFSVQPSGILH